ncbi:cell wall metabolism sensor histidine kinase WalK [bacterium]|nr:cell wall metabolism sensor histidine kinase WalK [bacterium]
MPGIDDLLVDYYKNLHEVTKGYGKPENLSNLERDAFLLDILAGGNPDFPQGNEKHFYLVFQLKEKCFIPFDGKNTTVPGLKEILGHEENIDFDYFLRNMVPEEILPEYLKIGLVTYQTVNDTREIVQVLGHAVQTDFYLKNTGGEIFRFSQEAIAFQLDKDKNLISHINRYSRRTKVRGSIEMSVGVGATFHHEPENEVTEKIFDRFDKQEFESIKSGLMGISPNGERIWRVLYEFVYLANLGGDTTSTSVFQNVIDTAGSPYEDAGYTKGLLRNDMGDAREWLNGYFLKTEHKKLRKTETMIPFLLRNPYFKQIHKPFAYPQSRR